MLVHYDKMPETARVWIYQADRNLSDAEVIHVQQLLEGQLSEWAAHGASLTAAVKVFFRRFVVITLDEFQNAASGCSIDTSVRWLKDLGAETGINFFDRSIAFWHNNEIKTVELTQIKSLVSEGILTPDTLIFNNLVAQKSEFQSKWQQKAGESWMKRYFQQIPA
ncbi:hypothetical protein SAMN04515674_103411 [Pseudarcicella hirudinis]|uniref:ABC transporter ATPase n=1 Tax=Pseudarcicella hirudinis TaxID=1079859 RepID=A0A1I5QX51_9BACT|nr:hypothetical protein [Pseudarcicella hirudinis]SFP50858.1 hypothetical protein SAMN04515674_103411 [Pseudarcicella hirudinis]